MCTTLQDWDPKEIREAFFKSTIDLSSVNPDEITCLLRVAVIKNDEEYATIILERVPDILMHDKGGGKILWHALENGNESLAKKLILAGADLNYRSRNGSSFLHRFMHKYKKIAILMIRKGADINITNHSKKTVMHVAVEENLEKIVDAITQLDIKYKDQFSILELAVSSPNAAKLLKYLIRSPDETRRKAQARTALIQYLKKMFYGNINWDLVTDLIRSALVPNYTISDVIEILKYAIVNKHLVKVVSHLLSYVEFLDGKSEEVASLLCQASRHLTSTMSTLLIRKGADVNTHNKNHDYPLHIACRIGSLQNIHLCLSLGADLTVTDSRGLTPFGCLYSPAFEESHKLVIRHLAIMTFKKIPIHENDRETILLSHTMRLYYSDCLNELREMRKTRIYERVTFFCFFDKTLEELTELVKHVYFLRMYYLKQTERNFSFPLYSMQIHNIFRMAIERKNILQTKAILYEEATMDAPPYVRINDTVHNIPDLEDFNRKFYCQLHERINNTQEINYKINLLC